MSRIYKSLIFGFLLGLTGVLFCLTPAGHRLDERIGLDLLFTVRGERAVPPDVVIVSIDRLSGDVLSLPDKPERWPHSLHARLVDLLTERGAKVIAFDIFFREQQELEESRKLTDAVSRAGNVVLVQSIKQEKIVLKRGTDTPSGDIAIEQLIPPYPSIAQSAVALSPFPLPKVPLKVSQYWTFKETAGNTPTLPVTAFQLYTLDIYEAFMKLLKRVIPSETAGLPRNREEFLTAGKAVQIIKDIRDIFERKPFLGDALMEEMRNSKPVKADAAKKSRVKSLIKMYQSPKSNYLNFYGYPLSIPTIPYYRALKYLEEPGKRDESARFRDKVVFIGSSEHFQPAQRDGFYTVFTQQDGLDISGVEIAATAFANLLEDLPVQPLPFYVNSLIIFLWGFGIGFLSRNLSNQYAAASGTLLSALYFIIILYQFTQRGFWYPLVIPVFFQLPIAFFGSLAWKYFDTNRERQNIKRAFRYYLPDEVVDRITRDVTDFETSSQVVYGTCLSTDADSYTSLSENMNPQELNSFLNRYYQSLFSPVKQHGGIVANIIADAMLALWVTGQPDIVSRKNACLAALAIRNVVNDPSTGNVYMPTRIGLHSGHISLGNIGAGDHYEYRPVGDIVNTSTRIEGMNKVLGTRILLSEEVLSQLEGFLTREVGSFLLAGKSKPIILHEMICLKQECTSNLRELTAHFQDALSAFKEQMWERALIQFSEIVEKFGQDGPSLFYGKLCYQYRNEPPDAFDNGVIIKVDKK